MADGQRAEEHGHVIDLRNVVHRICMCNIGRSAAQIERGTVQSRELRLVDLYPAAAAARRDVDAAVQYQRRVDARIVGDRERLQSAAAVSADGDARYVDAAMKIAVL